VRSDLGTSTDKVGSANTTLAPPGTHSINQDKEHSSRRTSEEARVRERGWEIGRNGAFVEQFEVQAGRSERGRGCDDGLQAGIQYLRKKGWRDSSEGRRSCSKGP
jgi:hypothetical protein